MKNKDVYNIRNILEKWSNYKNGNVAYAVAKNLELIDTLIDTFKRFRVITIDDYREEKKLICEKYSDSVVDGRYIINNDVDFNKEMDELDNNFLNITKILNNDCNIQFYKISKNDLPNDISANDLKDILFMID